MQKGGDDLMLYEESAAQTGGITVYQPEGDSDEENGPSSPFSEMLPSAYRYSENMSILSGQGLSAVTEVSESDSSQHSRSGCSEEAAGNETSRELVCVSKPLYANSDGTGSPNVLGARKRQEVSPRVGEDNILDISQAVEESFSDVSDGCDTSLNDCSATTKLLLGISSPTRMNTSQEEDAFLFLP